MKSHVAIERAVCPICGITYDTDTVLLDKRMKDSLENPMPPTHYAPCKEHQELLEDGYIALVGVNEELSTIVDGKIDQEGAYRTGTFAFVKKLAFNKIFAGVEEPYPPMIFVQEEVFETISKLVEENS